ncbi:MAG: hypothetical protein KDD61_05385 [Bdellovibrionales bacterium]|nr:hypothetical protein [Bdellovibrionales bacterium]
MSPSFLVQCKKTPVFSLVNLGLPLKIAGVEIAQQKTFSNKNETEHIYLVKGSDLNKVHVKIVNGIDTEKFQRYLRKEQAIIGAKYQQVVPPYAGAQTEPAKCPNDLMASTRRKLNESSEVLFISGPTSKKGHIGVCDPNLVSGKFIKTIIFCHNNQKIYDLEFYFSQQIVSLKDQTLLNLECLNFP